MRVTWKDKCCNSKYLPSLLSPPALYTDHDATWRFGSWGQLSSLCPLPASYAPPVPSQVGRETMGSRKSLESLQALHSNNKKPSLYYQHCFQHYLKTQSHINDSEEGSLHLSQNQHSRAKAPHSGKSGLQVPGRYGLHHLRQNFSI